MTSFAAHNVQLPDGSATFPDAGMYLADNPWFHAAQNVVRVLYGDDTRGKRIADLGCMEGGYTVAFAQMGMDATGIEVRTSNIENCHYLKNAFGLSNLNFIQDDVLNIGKFSPWDVIFCCGLLHHLESPRSFVKLMGQMARDAVIINTHFATERPSEVFSLSEMTEHEGLPGRWFAEHDLEIGEELERLNWNSWANKRSFWLTRPALLQSLRDAEFNMVFELVDHLADNILGEMTTGGYFTHSRGIFVGIRVNDRSKKQPAPTLPGGDLIGILSRATMR